MNQCEKHYSGAMSGSNRLNVGSQEVNKHTAERGNRHGSALGSRIATAYQRKTSCGTANDARESVACITVRGLEAANSGSARSHAESPNPPLALKKFAGYVAAIIHKHKGAWGA